MLLAYKQTSLTIVNLDWLVKLRLQAYFRFLSVETMYNKKLADALVHMNRKTMFLSNNFYRIVEVPFL